MSVFVAQLCLVQLYELHHTLSWTSVLSLASTALSAHSTVMSGTSLATGHPYCVNWATMATPTGRRAHHDVFVRKITRFIPPPDPTFHPAPLHSTRSNVRHLHIYMLQT